MKKILTILALVAIAATLCVVPVAFAAANEDITATIPSYDLTTRTITIADESQFLWLSTYSNGKETAIDGIPTSFSRWTINITATELDFDGMSWEPIADFHGTLNGAVGAEDGATTTISGLNVTIDTVGAGLCGNISFNEGLGQPQFNNITIANSSFTTSKAYAGAFAGNGYTAKFNNCHVVDTQVEGIQYVGGLVGSTYGSITNCSVTSTGNTINTSVKIPGSYSFLGDGDNAGGIVGFVGEGGAVISNCIVDYVEVIASRQVGGIAGSISYGNSVVDCIVQNSTVTSTVAGIYLSSLYTPATGGIVGEVSGNNASVVTVTGNQVMNTTVAKSSGAIALGNVGCGWIIGSASYITLGTTLICNNNTYPSTGTWHEIGNPISDPSAA